MKQGKCPKCGSVNIYSAEDLPLKSGPFGSNSIPVSSDSHGCPGQLCVRGLRPGRELRDRRLHAEENFPEMEVGEWHGRSKGLII